MNPYEIVGKVERLERQLAALQKEHKAKLELLRLVLKQVSNSMVISEWDWVEGEDEVKT